MNVEIICPLYNAENYILNLHNSILKQKNAEILKISYILTKSSDNTKQILEQNNINFCEIEKNEFSHSLTREKVALNSAADIVVFITQDIIIEREDWLVNLIKPIEQGEAEATFSRQISCSNNIEKYTREKNYPANSRIVSKNDIETLGLNTFFFSDAASAIKTEIFKNLNGYDHKNLPTNEDMYFAHKLIVNGFKIKYCADSVITHSHKFSLKQLYKRYYLIGQFFAQNSYLDKYGTTKAGGGLAKYILKRALKEFNIPVLFRFLPDMLARYFGMRNGKKSINKKRS